MTKLYISADLYRKLKYWIDKAPGEISGLGFIEYQDGDYYATDAFLLPQTNTGATTELDPSAIAGALYTHRDQADKLKWWWHSHSTMGVFWSGQDRETIAETSSQGWFVASVFNKAGEVLSAVSQGKPISLVQLDLPTEIYGQPHEPAWLEEYEKCCPEPVTKLDWSKEDLEEIRNSWKTDNYQRQDFLLEEDDDVTESTFNKTIRLNPYK